MIFYQYLVIRDQLYERVLSYLYSFRTGREHLPRLCVDKFLKYFRGRNLSFSVLVYECF